MRTLTVCVIVLMVLMATTLSWAERPVNQSVPAGPDTEISVSFISGSVTVTGWDQSEVKVEGMIGDDIEEFIVERSGDRIIVEARYPQGRRHADLDCDLTISIPAVAEIEVETVSGDVELEGAIPSASIRVNTFSGRIENNLSGDRAQRTSEHTPGKELDLVVGGGAARVSIDSFSGKVILGRR